MDDHSHPMTIIRGMIHLALYWPTWWFYLWIIDQEMWGLWPSLGKLIFYSNMFYMLIYLLMIAKGKREMDRECVKFSLWFMFIFIVMEIPVWLSVI